MVYDYMYPLQLAENCPSSPREWPQGCLLPFFVMIGSRYDIEAQSVTVFYFYRAYEVFGGSMPAQIQVVSYDNLRNKLHDDQTAPLGRELHISYGPHT